ncbi:MAG: ABC transporter permease [Candidatus Didemnitutus sp.]|nr:ABC transporter permease [Candidatus Didemnitutus sp.]
MHSLKTAFRSLLKSPGFTAVAVLTIAVGIGANTTLFTLFDRLMLNPVSFPEPSRLVAVWAVNNERQFVAPAISWPRFEELRRATGNVFESLTTTSFDSHTLTGNGEPEQVTVLRVTADFFSTIGIKPARGRAFTREEDLPNGPAVVILAHEYWQTRFGGRESILGENILLSGTPHHVVGIMPPRLGNPFVGVQVFVPRVFEVGGLLPAQIQAGAGYTQALGRLRPGVTLDQARAACAAHDRAYREQFASRLDADNQMDPRAFTETLVSGLRPTMRMMLGAVAFVLLIACANVASLFLGRLSARQREIAVRQSLGATRGMLVRQFLVESLLFSVVAGGLGVLLAVWSLSGIRSLLANQLPPDTALGVSLPALAATVGVTFVVGVLIGLFPAWQASQVALTETLKDSSRGSSGGPRGKRFRGALVVAEVALSVMLLVGSGLLLASFLKLQRTPPGFSARGVAAAFVGLPNTRYRTGAEQVEFYRAVIERLQAMPQIESAAAVIGLPLSGNAPRAPYTVGTDAALPLPQRPLAGLRIVTPGYLKTLGIPLREGRDFTERDREGAPGVCLINESFARRLFPGQSALGKVVRRGRDAEFAHEIVGVVADVRTLGLGQPPPDEVFYPLGQLPRPGLAIVARTTGDAGGLQAILRTAVASVDRDQPVSFFQTMENLLQLSLGFQRIVASLTALFAGIALVLAAVGLYSVLAYSVAQRTGEIGIRMALGAARGDVVALIVRQGLGLVAFGLGVGLAGAAGLAHLLSALLYEIRPFEPTVYAVVTVVFAGVAVLACLLPSWRASRVDPLVALRTE